MEGAKTVGKIGVGGAGGVVAQLLRAYYGICRRTRRNN
jgi:hypothetical protein